MSDIITDLTDEEVSRIAEEARVPSVWAEKYLRHPDFPDRPLVLRKYQKNVIDAPEQKITIRCGRQLGKSVVLCAWMLWYSVTHPGTIIIVLTPYISQIARIFQIIRNMATDSPLLHGQYKVKQTPYYEIKFAHNSIIRGFSAGIKSGQNADNVRGQVGDVLLFDECDYLNSKSITTLLPLLNSRPNLLIRASSTPTGLPTIWRDWCMKPELGFREYFIDRRENPNFSQDKDDYDRINLSKDEYDHEVCFHGTQLIQLSDGSLKQIKDIVPGDVLISGNSLGQTTEVKRSRITGKNKKTFKYETFVGDIICTKDHKVKTYINGEVKKIEIGKAANLILSPKVGIYPNTGNSALARLVGFINGGGSVCLRTEHSGKKYYQASFYSKHKEDLNLIAKDCYFIFGAFPNIVLKRGKNEKETSYQIVLNRDESEFLVKMGAVVGKKTAQKWGPPLWLLKEPLSVRLEFIGALWGAEGTSRTLRKTGFSDLRLRMYKTEQNLCGSLFTWVVSVLKEAGIVAKYSIKEMPKTSRKYKDRLISVNAPYGETLTINISMDVAEKVFSFLVPRYSVKKEKNFFKSFAYYKIKSSIQKQIHADVLLIENYNKEGKTRKEINKLTGWSFSKIDKVIYPDAKKRWSRVLNTQLKKECEILEDFIVVKIKRITYFDTSDVYNITVDSQDHSYLLANNFNIYNCGEWGDAEDGVFDQDKIYESLKNYPLNTLKRKTQSTYVMGVDWNEDKTGTVIVVSEFSFKHLPTGETSVIARPVHIEAVKKEYAENNKIISFTQSRGLEKIIALNDIYSPNYIYVDKGAGGLHIERLIQYGIQNKTSGLAEKIVPIDFGSSLQVVNPATGDIVLKNTKHFLVSNTSAMLNDNQLELPKEDDPTGKEGIVSQMFRYTIKKRALNGLPIYKEYEDHFLVAFMLSLGGFTLNYATHTKVGESAVLVAKGTQPFKNTSLRENIIKPDNKKYAVDVFPGGTFTSREKQIDPDSSKAVKVDVRPVGRQSIIAKRFKVPSRGI